MGLRLEVIVQTVEDARAAARGGADRLEVVRDIASGGLTPSLALVEEIAAAVSIPLRVMVRGNAGFSTDGAELDALQRAAAALAALRVDGLVAGFAAGCDPDIAATRAVLDAAPQTSATFHRAFDQLGDPLDGIDEVATIPQVDRILTSGGGGTPAERCERLRAYARRAGKRLIVVAGGNIDEEMLALIAQTGVCREVHVGRAARADGQQESPVSAARVARLRELAGIP